MDTLNRPKAFTYRHLPVMQFLFLPLLLSGFADVSAQSSAGNGSQILRASVVRTYADRRPSASYRLNAEDQGIVMRYGDGPDSCDYLGARDVWVFAYGGTYFMHYDGAGPQGWLVCLATSKDLVHWHKKGPVLRLGKPGTRDSRSASYGTVYRDGSRWFMFYLGTSHVSPAPNFIPACPYLTLEAQGASPSGPWRKHYDITPFSTKPGTYYATSASPGCILKTGPSYQMFFSPSSGSPLKRTLSIARTRNLKKPWILDKTPILPPDEQVENSSIYYDPQDKMWFLFTNHVGIQKGFEYTDAIWVYWTKDLARWNPHDKAVVLDAGNCSWSKYIIGLPSVVHIGNRLAIFYDGNEARDFPEGYQSHMKRDIGLAWLNLPIRLPAK